MTKAQDVFDAAHRAMEAKQDGMLIEGMYANGQRAYAGIAVLKGVLTPATEDSVTIRGFATDGSRTLASCHATVPSAVAPHAGRNDWAPLFEQRYQMLFNDLEAMHVMSLAFLRPRQKCSESAPP